MSESHKRGGRGGGRGKSKTKLPPTAAEEVPIEAQIPADTPMDVAQEVEVGRSEDPKLPPEDQEVFLTAVTPKDVTDDSCRTFIFKNEGHTLGNALRCVITHYPEVKFCGHTIPHPSENEMHLRIQTVGISAADILRRGLHDLIEVCDHTEETFTKLVKTFKEEHPGCEIEIPEPTLESILAARDADRFVTLS